MLREAEQGVPVVVVVNKFVALRHLNVLISSAFETNVSVQVSSMGALVSQVEELVETAEMSCSMMQVRSCWLGFRNVAAARKPAAELM